MTFFQENAIALYIEIGILAVLVVMTDLSRGRKILMNTVAISALLSAAVVLNAPSAQPRSLPVVYRELRAAQPVHPLGRSTLPVVDRLLMRPLRDERLVSAYSENTLYRRFYSARIRRPMGRATRTTNHAPYNRPENDVAAQSLVIF